MKETIDQFAFIVSSFLTKSAVIPGLQQMQRADVYFQDGTRLVAQEYQYFDTGRTKYSYQWMTSTDQLIHRWDNAYDYPDLPSSPHHQHVGSEDNVHPSEPMTLEKVLQHIASQLSPR